MMTLEPVAIHTYQDAIPPLAICINLEITQHPPASKIVFDPTQVHYWFCDIIYLRNTTVDTLVPEGFLDHPNTYMVIQVDHEGMTLDDINPNKKCFDKITSTLPPERIILVVGSKPQLDYVTRLYPMLCKNVFMFNYWEIWSRRVVADGKRMARTADHSRRFLYLNRRNYAERLYAFSLLWRSQEFKDRSYTSFNPGSYWNPELALAKTETVYIHEVLKECFDPCRSIDPNIDTWFFQQTLPQLPERYSSSDPFTYNMQSPELLQAYVDTDINIVVESNAYRIAQEFFPTEKLFRSIGMHSPFIVYGQPGYYKNLKALGYMTYEKVFNETHDSIKDNWQRGQSFADTVIKLANLTDDKFGELIESIRHIRKHNYWNFIKRTNLDTLAALLPESAKPLAGFLRYPPW